MIPAQLGLKVEINYSNQSGTFSDQSCGWMFEGGGKRRVGCGIRERHFVRAERAAGMTPIFGCEIERKNRPQGLKPAPCIG